LGVTFDMDQSLFFLLASVLDHLRSFFSARFWIWRTRSRVTRIFADFFAKSFPCRHQAVTAGSCSIAASRYATMILPSVSVLMAARKDLEEVGEIRRHPRTAARSKLALKNSAR